MGRACRGLLPLPACYVVGIVEHGETVNDTKSKCPRDCRMPRHLSGAFLLAGRFQNQVWNPNQFLPLIIVTSGSRPNNCVSYSANACPAAALLTPTQAFKQDSNVGHSAESRQKGAGCQPTPKPCQVGVTSILEFATPDVKPADRPLAGRAAAAS